MHTKLRIQTLPLLQWTIMCPSYPAELLLLNHVCLEDIVILRASQSLDHSSSMQRLEQLAPLEPPTIIARKVQPCQKPVSHKVRKPSREEAFRPMN